MFNETVTSPFMEYNGSTIPTGNATVFGSDHHQYWTLTYGIVLSIILIISSLLSIFGNLMVITVVIRHRGMRTRTNLFLVNLAIADFLVGFLAVPVTVITLIAGKWVLPHEICVINGFLNPLCLFASIHTLMYISMHKYYSITKPFSNSFKLRTVIIMIACSWIWACFSATITVVGMNHIEFKNGTSQCGPSYPHDLLTKAHHGIIITSNFIIPVVILFFCYLRMFKEIRAHTKRLRQNSTLEQDVVLAQQKKVAVTLFIVLACFIICWLPYNIYTSYVTNIKDKAAGISGYINPLVYMFGYLNSSCNPIIYAFRSPSFREGYKEIICRTPTYVISDGGQSRKFMEYPSLGLQSKALQSDILLDEGATRFRRLSSFLLRQRGAVRTPSSPEQEFVYHSTTSLSSNIKHNPRANFKREKSLTELMRSASKHGNGSSIIHQDNSVVIMKGGKIVSVRKQNELPKGSPLLKGGGIFSSRTERETTSSEKDVKLSPLLTNGRFVTQDKAEDSNSCGSDDVFDLHRENTQETCLCADNMASVDMSETRKLLSSPDILFEETVASKEKDVNIVVSGPEDNTMLSAMPLTPHTKRLARSDLFLEASDKNVHKTLKGSRSSEGLVRTPLLRCPSVEHLDIPGGVLRSTSDVNIKRQKPSPRPSPSLVRRWTFNKVKT